MGDLGEPVGNRGANRKRRTVSPFESRKPRLDCSVTPLQRVVFGIGNNRRIIAMIGLVMPRNLGREKGEFRRRFLFAQVLNGFVFLTHDGTLTRLESGGGS